MFLFRVSERFNITDLGLILLPGLKSNYVPVGTPITIIRPDKTEIETRITSITFETKHITIEKSFSKEDVPIGSEVWAKKSITYDLTYYILTEKKSHGSNLEIIFKHKVDHKFLMTLKLSGVVAVTDHLQQNKPITKMRIELSNSSYATDLALQLNDEEIKTYPEVLIFSDAACIDVIFKSVAKEITYNGERVEV